MQRTSLGTVHVITTLRALHVPTPLSHAAMPCPAPARRCAGSEGQNAPLRQKQEKMRRDSGTVVTWDMNPSLKEAEGKDETLWYHIVTNSLLPRPHVSHLCLIVPFLFGLLVSFPPSRVMSVMSQSLPRVFSVPLNQFLVAETSKEQTFRRL